MARIISGFDIAKSVYSEFRSELDVLVKNVLKIPLVLAVIYVGDDAASKVYISCKRKACEKLGIKLESYIFDSFVEEKTVVKLIKSLNIRADVTGILVQLPLSDRFFLKEILSLIDENKDVDALNPENLGKLVFPTYKEEKNFAPCTALAILKILEYENIDLSGKNVVIIGKSNIVGKPLALLTSQKKATVTLCDSKTKDLKYFCKNADIVVSATGVKNLINKEMVSEKSIIIDAGISKNTDGNIAGDVNFSEVAPIVRAITPVPGGVGPVTVAMLIKNLFIAAKNKAEKNFFIPGQ